MGGRRGSAFGQSAKKTPPAPGARRPRAWKAPKPSGGGARPGLSRPLPRRDLPVRRRGPQLRALAGRDQEAGAARHRGQAQGGQEEEEVTAPSAPGPPPPAPQINIFPKLRGAPRGGALGVNLGRRGRGTTAGSAGSGALAADPGPRAQGWGGTEGPSGAPAEEPDGADTPGPPAPAPAPAPAPGRLPWPSRRPVAALPASRVRAAALPWSSRRPVAARPAEPVPRWRR